ncbi:ABC transporter ATP-binding protein [Spiroplasma helicoides]|uniref:ABC transporter ATP-binding protein n=1 Tax=Spiroplasma helicoides TaxID=216938 RepID=A0A1B3SJY4_9MOLU|nr:ABC transporter ATP-binding protein [Spiroplasma helicoides]AOG60241.1 ABC transporter ATP-binding protein [Spiroplasma helicoides]
MNEKQQENINATEEKNETLFKEKRRKGTFFGIVLKYWKKHKWSAMLLIFISIISAMASISSPKIIQNIMNNILSPSKTINYFKNSSNQEMTIKEINYFLKGWSFLKGDNETILTGASGLAYISDSSNYYTTFFSLKMGWHEWIYLQICLFGILAGTSFTSNLVAGTMGKNIEIDLRNKSLEKLVKQDMSYYSDKKIGELLTKLVSDTQIIGEQSQQVPVTILSSIFTFFGSLGILLSIDLKLTGVVVVLMIFIWTLLLCTFWFIKKLVNRVRKSLTNINGDVTDRIATVRLIKASGTEKFETKRFIGVHKDYYKKSISLITFQSIIITVMVAGLSSIQMVIVIFAAIFYKNDPTYLAVTLSAFISGVGTMAGPLMQMSKVIGGLVQASSCSQRIMKIINAKPLIDTHYKDNQGIYIDKIEGDIIFKDVEFRYPEKPTKLVLPKFSFTFKKGKSYAFVGETGAGKSTISKLLLRFYDPTKGIILINENINLKDIHLSSYLDKVGYVEQEPQVLYGDIFDNIKYGNGDATEEQIIDAAKKANLHDLVMTWPDNYKTILGERGFMLSGGQKQRLVIARMFLKDPQLLILDEATSALDNIVEKEIQAELDKLMKGRTTVSIAHRLSTIINCDQIIVLGREQGVVQVGTYEELKKQPGHFRRLFEAGLME